MSTLERFIEFINAPSLTHSVEICYNVKCYETLNIQKGGVPK